MCQLPPASYAMAEDPTKAKLKAKQKVDAEGVYQPFPGVTVVCDIPRSDEGPLATLPDTLKALPTLGPLFAPLPPVSYHVTTLDILTKFEMGLADDPAGWAAVLAQSCWAPAVKAVADAQTRPELRVKDIVLTGNTIRVELEPAAESTCSHPRDLGVNATLMELVGMDRNQLHPWHFTLAYCTDHAAQEAASPDALEQDRIAILKAVKEAVPETVPLEEAKLCRFEDMTAFVPWDGGAS